MATTRIGNDNYKKKSKKSAQAKMSPDDIKEKLKDYITVKNIYKTPLKTHVRYFTIDKKTGKNVFRMGGFLNKVNDEKEYVILTNGKITWSVQVNNSQFWRKLSLEEIRQEYEEEIKILKKNNKILKEKLKKIKNQAKKR